MNYNFCLDLIRITSSLLVFFTHLGQHVGFNFNGASGVVFFFILSGYLSCLSLDYCSTKEFYKKRITKILPSYYVCLIIIFVIYMYMGNCIDKKYLSIFSYKFLRYPLFVNQILPSDNYEMWNNLCGLWSMTSFMVFYLLSPLIKKYINTTNKSLIFYVASLVFIYFTKKYTVSCLENTLTIDKAGIFYNFHPLSNIMYYVLGFSIANRDESKKIILFSLFFICFCICSGKLMSELPTYIYLLIICLLSKIEINTNLMIKKTTKALSEITFELYLLHPILLILFDNILQPCFSNKIIYSLTVFIIVFLFALFVNRIIIKKIRKNLIKLLNLNKV